MNPGLLTGLVLTQQGGRHMTVGFVSKMLRRRWIAAVGIGLLIAVSPILAQEPVNPALENQTAPAQGQDQGRAAGQQTTAPEHQNPASLLSTIQGIEGAIRELMAQQNQAQDLRKENREVRDLQAQEDMVLWARCMFWATVAGVCLTAIGILLGAL